MTKLFTWTIVLLATVIVDLSADAIEVIYRWQEPASQIDAVVFDRFTKTLKPSNAYYYYLMYACSKDDILISRTPGRINQTWIPERILLDGKPINYDQYLTLAELSPFDKYTTTYYQQTPAGLLKLGDLNNKKAFRPDVRFVNKVSSEIGEKSDAGMWDIAGTALVVGGIISYFQKSKEEQEAPPIAFLSAIPSTGTLATSFYFDASASYDYYEPQSNLSVRWDWTNDGTWDTPYSTIKTATHQFTSAGTYTVKVEVIDKGKLTTTETVLVNVIPNGSPLLSSPSPMFHHDITHTGLSPYQGPFTNTIKWSYTTTGKIESSPAIDAANNIYFTSYDGNLYKVTPMSTTAWTYSVGGFVHSSPAIATDGTIYVGSGTGMLHAVTSAGAPKWTFNTDNWLKSSPAIGPDGTIYIGSTNGYLFAINWDGSFAWAQSCGNYIESSPAIGPDGTIYVGSNDGNLYALNPNSTIKWIDQTDGSIVSSPAVAADGTIYIGSTDGYFYAINPNGTLKWQYQTGGAIHSSPAIDSSGKIYFGSDDNKLYCLDSTGAPASGFPFTTGDNIRSSPTIASDGAIYVGSDDGKVYCISPTGTANWSYTTGDMVRSIPVIGSNSIIYVGADDNKLYAIGQNPPDPANLVIDKKANKHQVTIGDIITYQITIINNGVDPTDPTRTTNIMDRIPAGFKYIKGSTILNGVAQPDPTGNTTLSFDVGDFIVGEKKTLSYQLVVGSGVTFGKYQNKAYAIYYYNVPPITEGRSNTASEEVRVTPDPIFDLGTIIGKVFYDRNNNGVQDEGEEEIKGAKIIMEDGTIVTTDQDGKYHIPGVVPGTHLLNLKLKNERTKELRNEETSSSVSPSFSSSVSRVVRVTEGLLCKVNFGVVSPPAGEAGPAPVVNASEPQNASALGGQNSLTLVALGEGVIGYNKTSGNLDPLKTAHGGSDAFDKGFYSQGHTAAYLKAEIKDTYRITSSLDTDRIKNRELYRYIDQDKFYLNYGDNSKISWDATNTQGPLYLFVEHLPSESSFLVGNYQTEINQSSTGGSAGGGTELLTYNRTLYGAKLSYQTSKPKDQESDSGTTGLSTTLFAAEAHQLAAHNEFKATGGSFYYLNNTNITEGSEQVRIEVRDKITNLPLSTNYQERTKDYEIDYSNGRILFKQAIGSVESAGNLISTALLNGNPVYIIIDYEYTPDRFDWNKNSYGGRVSVGAIHELPLRIGATYVKEETADRNYELKGADASITPFEKIKLEGEYAESNNFGISNYLSTDGGLTQSKVNPAFHPEGSAYSIKAGVEKIPELPVQMYYKRLQPGFISSDTITQQDTEKYGLNATYKISEKLSLNGRYDAQELLSNEFTSNEFANFHIGAQRTNTASLQGKYVPNNRWSLLSEFRHQDAHTSFDSIQGETNQDTDVAAARVERRFYGGILTTYLGQQATLKGDTNHQSTMGASANVLDPKTMDTVANARLEATSGTKGNAGLIGFETKLTELANVYSSYKIGSQEDEFTSSRERESAFVVGTAVKPDDSTRIYSQQEYRKSETANANAGTVGVDKTINKFWRWSGSAERSHLQNYDLTETERYAFSTWLGYTAPLFKFNTKLETRFDENTNKLNPLAANGDKDQYLTANSFNWQVGNGFSLLGRLNWSETFNQAQDSVEALYHEYGLGVAYRPVKFDRLNLIAKYTYLTDLHPAGQTVLTNVTNQRSNVYSMEAAYDLTPKLQVVEKYALKDGEEKALGHDWTDSKTTLWLNRINYEFIKNWTAGVEYRILKQYLAEDQKSGYLAEILYKLSQNFQVGVGYNFTDFSDDLTANGDYSVKGPFIRFVGTFCK